MEIHDVGALTRTLPTLDLAQRPSYKEAMVASPLLGSLGACEVRIARYVGQPPWERHAGDELIHVLDGEVALTLLDAAEPRTVTLAAGALVIVPSGVWHRSRAEERVTVLAATPADGSESSLSEDPR